MLDEPARRRPRRRRRSASDDDRGSELQLLDPPVRARIDEVLELGARGPGPRRSRRRRRPPSLPPECAVTMGVRAPKVTPGSDRGAHLGAGEAEAAEECGRRLVAAVGEQGGTLDVDLVPLAVGPAPPGAVAEPGEVALGRDAGPQVGLEVARPPPRRRSARGRARRSVRARRGGRAGRPSAPGRPGRRSGVTPKLAIAPAKHDRRAGDHRDEVLLLLPAHRVQRHRRRELHRRVDDVADGSGAELVVELGGEAGVQAPEQLGVGGLVEVGRRLGPAVDGGQAEPASCRRRTRRSTTSARPGAPARRGPRRRRRTAPTATAP